MNPKAQFGKDFFFALILLGISFTVLGIFQPYFWMVIFPDDAYYYLRTARNLAAGLGSSFDGINKTNGYHPLWMLLLWALASIFKDPVNLLRGALVFQVLAVSAGFAFLGRAFSETGKPGRGLRVAAALFFLNPVLASVFINGLESSVYFLALAIGFWLWMNLQKKNPRPWPSWFGAGLAFGLVFLSRLDSGVLAVWLGIAILISREGWAAKIKKAAGFGTGFVLLAVPYLAYNFLEYGHPVPISGRVKSYYMSHDAAYLSALSISFALVIGGLLVFHFRSRSRLPGFSKTLLSYLEFSLSAVFYYLLTPVFALGAWYYLPAALVAILILGWLLELLFEDRSALAKATARGLVFLGLLGVLAGFFLYAYPPFNSLCKAQTEAADWIKKSVPEGARLAAWSSGAVGYFSDRCFINMDGLINSSDYFFNYRVKGKREQFMKKMGVDYIVIYYNFDAPVPHRKFSFKITKVFESKVRYRGPATFFKPGVITYFVLQTDFCQHPPRPDLKP